VREAVSGLVQEGLLERRDGLGTFVVDPRKYKTVGVVSEIDLTHPATSYYWRQVVRGVRTALADADYFTRTYLGESWVGTPPPAEVTNPELKTDLEKGRILALAVVGMEPDRPWVQAVRKQGIPVVCQDDPGPISWNYGLPALIRQGVEHLVDQGRRRLAVADWTEDGGTFSSVLAEHGLQPRAEWIACGLDQADYTIWRRLADIWSGPERPDGLIVGDDMLFYRLLPAFVRLGLRLPEDLLIVTHANRGDPRMLEFPVARLEVNPDLHAEGLVAGLMAALENRPMPAAPSRAPLELLPLS
jgi:DNA-binding LacI/PurR family transcriptional regulator